MLELRLGGNQFNGHIPPELGNFTGLEALNLSNNQLTGEIPPELGNIDTLERLTLHDNQLSGEIPAELGNLDNLKSLTLHENQLGGEIPSEVWNMLEREVEIEIHGNHFPCLTGGFAPPIYRTTGQLLSPRCATSLDSAGIARGLPRGDTPGDGQLRRTD